MAAPPPPPPALAGPPVLSSPKKKRLSIGDIIKREKEEGKRKPRKKWTVTTDNIEEKLDFSLSDVVPHPDRSAKGMDWSTLDGIKLVEDAAVAFFKFDSKYIVSFKASSEQAQELYGVKLAQLLGMECATFRLVFQCDDECVDIRCAIATLCGETFDDDFKKKGGLKPVQGSPSMMYAQIKPLLLQASYSIMDFIPGKGLDQVSDSNITENVLKTMGALLALDVLTNNGDRMPVIWANAGNPGNVHISTDRDRVVALDNRIVPVLMTTEKKAASVGKGYKKKVMDLVDDVRKNGCDAAGFVKLQKFIEHHANDGKAWDEAVAKKRRQFLLDGFMDNARKIAKLTLADFEAITASIKGLCKHDTASGAWAAQCSSFEDAFFAQNAACLGKLFAE